MRTITYTYDETNPTNRDYLIAALAGDIDDGGASYDAAARYNIECPYSSDRDCYNEHFGNDYGTAAYREGCLQCKLAWLARKYDTSPSDDGKWELEE